MYVYFSVLEFCNEMLGEYVVKCFYIYGICVIDNFLGEIKGLLILLEVKVFYNIDKMISGEFVNCSYGFNV